MKYFRILLILFSFLGLFISPNFTKDHTRTIASFSVNKEKYKRVINELLAFENVSSRAKPELQKFDVELFFSGHERKNMFLHVKLINEPVNLSNNVSYRVTPRILSDQYLLEISYSNDGLKDDLSFLYMKEFLNQISDVRYSTKFNFFELLYNASEGSASALLTLVNLKQLALEELKKKYPLKSEELVKFKKIEDRLNKISADINIDDKAQKTKKVSQKKLREKLINFDKNKLYKLIKYHVANNNRTKVAEIVEKVLPWENMQPFETKMYKDYIAAIKEPVPLEKRLLLFRGIDNNTIYPSAEHPAKASIRDALYHGRIFLISHFLDRQDLNSKHFETYHHTGYLKDLGTKSNKYQRITSVTSYFNSHSKSSFRSMHISTSTELHVAMRFGEQKISMLAIDPRVAQFNYASNVSGIERELLVPFLIFPDEIVASINYFDRSSMSFSNRPSRHDVRKLLDNAAYRKINDRSVSDVDKLISIMESNTKKFTDRYLDNDSSLMGPNFDHLMRKLDLRDNFIDLSSASGSCQDLISKFF